MGCKHIQRTLLTFRWILYDSLGYKYAGDWRARLLVRDPTKILFLIDFRSIQTMFRHLLSDYEDDRIATHVPTLHPHSEVRVFDGAMGMAHGWREVESQEVDSEMYL